ncbi:MAG TPA: hypothetical protein VFJ02_02050 [Vicinamibacterales bacterium]|nr:hypothetical protein [Vicinamibacterales bacterium]
MLNQQFLIAIVIIIGLLGFLIMAVSKLGSLSASDDNARAAFLKLMDPASLVSLMILMGVLFLLGMAILDLDKGRVLAGMGKAQFARGLITYLFAVVTIGTAVVLVLSAVLGTDKEKFDRGKEVLGLLLGVFGTMVGFYFASELAKTEAQGALMVSSVLVAPQEVAAGGTVRVTAFVRGGTPPYRFAITLGAELPGEFPKLARPDGWITEEVQVPASLGAGLHTLLLGVQDMAGEKATAQALVTSTAPPSPK